MGTRADFYIGRGEQAEWLGSVAWDGYPSGIDHQILESTNAAQFRGAVNYFLRSQEHATLPDQGWPWPWDDSQTTDYAYALDGDKVYASCFGHPWFDPLAMMDKLNEPVPPDVDEDEWYETLEHLRAPKDTIFPNMSTRRNLAMPGSRRSGVCVYRMP
jgi:hypothetical protein